MKRIFQFLLFLVIATSVFGQQQRRELSDAIRIINGKEYDLRPLFTWYYTFKGDSPMPEWRLYFGSVVQVVTDGLLVQAKDEGGDLALILIRNHPDQSKMYDGARFGAFVFPSEPYQYNSVGGGQKTIRSFDYGHLPDAKRLLEIQKEDEIKRKEHAKKLAEEAKAKKAAHEQAVKDSKKKLEELRKRNE